VTGRPAVVVLAAPLRALDQPGAVCARCSSCRAAVAVTVGCRQLERDGVLVIACYDCFPGLVAAPSAV
jgi:hypothetical protein